MSGFAKDPYPVKDPPAPPGVRASDIPDAMLPSVPPARELVEIGQVCGQTIFARRDIVEKSKELAERVKAGRDYWPSDALLATILALRMGMKPKPTYREIAVMLNMSERHVLRVVGRGRKAANVEREIARLDGEGMPMAVENVLEGLESKDKEYTLEYLKGRGVFQRKTETTQNGGVAAPTGLIVQFIHEGSAPNEARPGSIVANPNRALAPAVIDVEKS
jgi:hypothetical protein